jgi:hypothetical protein
MAAEGQGGSLIRSAALRPPGLALALAVCVAEAAAQAGSTGAATASDASPGVRPVLTGAALPDTARPATIPDPTPPAQPVTPANPHILDDRARPGGGTWRFFTDAVMGGVSRGTLLEETVDGRRALCLRGEVRLENNGGFVQMALELPRFPATAPDGQPWQGVELDVYGNGRRYGLHLRDASMSYPWQAFRAGFTATRAWQTVRVPWVEFLPYRFTGEVRPEAITRIGVLGIGERMDAEVCVARVALYR